MDITITRKRITKIIGIALIVVGLSVFGVSYDQGSIGQNNYSAFMCTVSITVKTQCIIANNQMTGGFIGMIFGFFTALFGASLVAPSVLRKLIRIRIKKDKLLC